MESFAQQELSASKQTKALRAGIVKMDFFMLLQQPDCIFYTSS